MLYKYMHIEILRHNFIFSIIYQCKGINGNESTTGTHCERRRAAPIRAGTHSPRVQREFAAATYCSTSALLVYSFWIENKMNLVNSFSVLFYRKRTIIFTLLCSWWIHTALRTHSLCICRYKQLYPFIPDLIILNQGSLWKNKNWLIG